MTTPSLLAQTLLQGIEEIVAAERERCAKICDVIHMRDAGNLHEAGECAAAIRGTEATSNRVEKESNPTRQTGRVQWFSDSKGYGHIVPDDGGAPIFAHFSWIEGDGPYKTLREGARVEFNVSAGPKGKQATHIREVKS